ncbi:elongation factor G, partial [bacterium]|nr:elongation factor G [bacterium]
DQEKERGITITSAATTIDWQECRLNLIDTPGHVDFTAEVERSLRILDGAVVIFCAVEGVEPQSEAVWHRAEKYNLPRIVFVNKMDRMGANFFNVLDTMSKRLDAKTVPIQIPVGAESEFVGVIDLLNMQMLRWDAGDQGRTIATSPIPKARLKLAQRYRDRLVEAIACTDEALLERVTDRQPVSVDELNAALRRAVIDCELVPVLCGSALKNAGVQPVLQAVCDYFPSPLERPPTVTENLLTHKRVEVVPDASDPCALLVFKVMYLADKVKVWYCRVYSGTVKEGDILYNSTRKVAERVSHVLHVHGVKRERTQVGNPGDIVALVGLKNTYTGDTLCSSVRPLVLEAMDFPEPVVSIAIEPKVQCDIKKLVAALKQLCAEDPTFRVKLDKETGQTVISGLGELHLEILVERLRRRFKVQTRTGQPQVAYKEGIKRNGSGTGSFSRTLASSVTQSATVNIDVKPAARGQGLVYSSEVELGYRQGDRDDPIRRAIQDCMSSGVLMGYPLIDVEANVISVEEENLDRRDQAFYGAAAVAFRKSLQNAHPVLLEPIMKGEIMTPREYGSRVIEGLGSRGGKITEIMTRGQVQIISVCIPLEKTFGFTTQLRSETQGRASYMLSLSHYAEVK